MVPLWSITVMAAAKEAAETAGRAIATGASERTRREGCDAR